MQPTMITTRSSWRYAAFGGAALCSTLALAYTFAFLLYALARSTFTVVSTINPDTGVLGTLIATWASLVVAALIIGVLPSMAIVILGAFVGIIVKTISIAFNPQHAPQRAIAIGACICLILVILLHLALRSAMSFSLPDLLSMHALFWLEIPSVIFVVAGGMASWQLNRSVILMPR